MISEQLLERQCELEDYAQQKGIERFQKRLKQAQEKGAASTVGAAHRKLVEGLPAMVKALTLLLDPKQRGPYFLRKWCKKTGPEVAAFITLKVLMDRMGDGKKYRLTQHAQGIGQAILEELRMRRFQEQAPALFDYKMKSFQGTSHHAHKVRSLNASMHFAGIETRDLEMPATAKTQLGMRLLNLALVETGMFQVETTLKVQGKKRKREQVLVLTDAAVEWILNQDREIALWEPIPMPMICKPLRWGFRAEGGYRGRLKGCYPLVRGDRKDVQLHRQMPVVFEALNALQDTAWKVNRNVLTTILELEALGGGIAGIPSSDPEPLPAKPHDIEENEEARRAWRRLAAPVHTRNNLRKQQAASYVQKLAVAMKLKGESALFFPHSLDFRGRVYPIPTSLNPQSDDLARALLLFRDGKPVDAEGAHWLAVHGANCMGETPDGKKVSKMTFEERREWVIKNSAMIVACADRPTVEQWWATAEEPLQFLAFCFEWANLIRANDRGEHYVCSLPCSMDGSCNGLQHFSALLLDEEGGKAVNLVPQDKPQDIYDRIAEAVLDRLQTPVEGDSADEPIAMRWLGLHTKLGLVNRKLCKRPTMTFGYGSKKYGFSNQLKEYLRGLPEREEIEEQFTDKDGKLRIGKACDLMSGLIWEALRDVIVSAFDGMAWLQKATRGISSENKPVVWTVPVTGFQVKQWYTDAIKRQVRTVLHGKVYCPFIYEKGKRIDSRKQGNAISPNLIHSFDAAVLMMTVLAAKEQGIRQFSMIHDSYGTVPTDCAKLARVCREEFVRFYTGQDVLALIGDELRSQWDDPSEFPTAPQRGSLDVTQILQSPYFFA